MRTIGLLGVALILQVTVAGLSHGATLDIRNGMLFGASGVEVNGSFYDVAFRDGTCIELFDECNENTDFPFTDPSNLNDSTLGLAANAALLDQVFVDSPAGAFDTSPDLTNGCFAPGGCNVNTPLWVNGVGGLGIMTAFNWRQEHQDVSTGQGGGSSTFDTRPQAGFERFDLTVYAVWSPTSPVPAPSAVSMWLAGLALLGFVGKAKNRLARGAQNSG